MCFSLSLSLSIYIYIYIYSVCVWGGCYLCYALLAKENQLCRTVFFVSYILYEF